MEEGIKKDIKIPNITLTEEMRKIREERIREEERRQKIIERNKRKAVQRKNKKKKIKRSIYIAAIATIAIGGLNYATRDPLEVASSNVQKYISTFNEKEGKIITEYGEEAEELEQQMDNIEQSSNGKLSYIADDAQEKIDVQISKLADKMVKDFGGLSSIEVRTSCTKRTEDKQYYYYDFSSYHKKSVVSNWLKKYFNITQIDNVYNNLSEEEINALIAFTTYGRIENWEGGKNNKEDFLKNFGFTSDKSDKEKLEDAKKIANDVSFRVAKESLSQQLGQSLDIETESVGRGK